MRGRQLGAASGTADAWKVHGRCTALPVQRARPARAHTQPTWKQAWMRVRRRLLMSGRALSSRAW